MRHFANLLQVLQIRLYGKCHIWRRGWFGLNFEMAGGRKIQAAIRVAAGLFLKRIPASPAVTLACQADDAYADNA